MNKIRGSLLAAVASNRQFVAFALLLVIVVAAFPGSPGRTLLGGRGTAATPSFPPVGGSPPPHGQDATPPAAQTPEGQPEPEPQPGGDLTLPPGTPPAPRQPCNTDALFEVVHEIRAVAAGAVGHVPGESLERLAQLATGCTEEDPGAVLIEVALDLAKAAPDLGLPTIPLPELPAMPDLPIPREVIEILGPAGDGIREACSWLAIVSLIFVVLPPALHLPFRSGDLIQLIMPASALCALFDENPS